VELDQALQPGLGGVRTPPLLPRSLAGKGGGGLARRLELGILNRRRSAHSPLKGRWDAETCGRASAGDVENHALPIEGLRVPFGLQGCLHARVLLL
jgi:hypothetical protein